MNLRRLITAVVLGASALSALPSAADAHGRHHGHYHHPGYYRADYPEPRYYRAPDCRTSGTTGLIVGGAAGALLGRQLDGGRDRTTGTILGAGAGALLGREISRKSHC